MSYNNTSVKVGLFLACFGNLDPVKIFPHRNTAGGYNTSKQMALPGKERVYVAEGDTKGEWPSPKEVRLKVGSQVIFVANMEQYGVVNGTTGIVKEFESTGDSAFAYYMSGKFPKVEYVDKKGGESAFRWSLFPTPGRGEGS